MDTKEPERSLLDLFGKDFTLLVLSPNAPLQEWEHGAQKLGLPMVILDFHDSHARQLYGADLVLIRPDHHVAWRGGCDSPAESVLAQAIGRLAYTAT